MNNLAIAIPQNNAPEPLIADTGVVTSYPIDALGKTLGGAAQAIHQATQAPMALCGQSVLMSAALITQGYKLIEMPHGTIPLSLFSLIMAESGERKSATDDLAMAPIRKYEQLQEDKFKEKWNDYLIQKSAYQEAERTIKRSIPGDIKGEQAREWVKSELKKLEALPAPPMNPSFTIDNATIEGIAHHFRESLPVLGLYSGEGGSFFGGHSMNKDNIKKTISILSEAWNGKPITMMRADREIGTFKLRGRAISINLLTQPIVGLEALGDSLMSGQGFIARFLISYPESNIGKRLYKKFDLNESKEYKRYFAKLMNILESGFIINEHGGLDRPPLKLSKRAEDLYIAFHDEIEKSMGKNQPYSHLTGEASKIAEQALRIAGILSVIEHGKHCQSIGGNEMLQGIELARYSLSELLRITNQAVISQDTKDAIKLLEWITENQQSLFCPSAYTSSLPYSIRKKETRDSAIFKLVEHGYLEQLEPGTVFDGRKRKEIYKVLHYA